MKSSFGSIQLVSSGRYRVYWTEGRKPDGKPLRRSLTVRGTRDDAELALARVRLGMVEPADSTTWAQYWELAVRPTFEALEPKTVSGYERVWRVELAPRIGFQRVSALTWRVANETLRSVRAPSVQRAAYRLLRKIANMAVNDGLLERCPVDCSIKLRPENRREKTVPDPAAVLALLDAARGTRYAAPLLLELGCGLRHEEACAVIASDVTDIGGGMAAVSVSRALVTVDGVKVLKGLKTRFSDREVVCAAPFAAPLLDIAADRDAALLPGREPRGSEPNESWFANPMHVSRNWRKWCERQGVDYVRFADMRTAYSIHQGEAGSPDSLVALAMGHSDGTTRGRNYQKATRRGMELIAANLADYYADCTRTHAENWQN